MHIRLITEEDAEWLSAYYTDNATHFKPWEPLRPDGFHTVASWRERARGCVLSQDKKEAAYFVAVSNSEILSHCSLTQIVHGPFRACYMGYGVAIG